MNTIKLYDLIHDANEKPELSIIHEYEVLENEYDEEYGIDLMQNLLKLGKMDSEHLYCLAINSNNEIVGIINIALGNYKSVQVYRRNIILFLALTGAKGFADYHNHPNNVIKASSDDIVSKAQMENIANLLEIEYLGSFILGRDKYLRVGEN